MDDLFDFNSVKIVTIYEINWIDVKLLAFDQTGVFPLQQHELYVKMLGNFCLFYNIFKISIQAMLEYIISAIIVSSLLLIYSCVIKPKKLYARYIRDITSLGYKVHVQPFAPFQFPEIKYINQGTKAGDALKFWKTNCPVSDVIVRNFMNQIVIDISHIDFIKDFHSNEHIYTYPKQKILIMALQRAMGKGVLFSEGNQWKKKRGFITSVFNFEFIKSMTGKIQRLCQRTIEEVQNQAPYTTENGEKIVEYQVIDFTLNLFSSTVLECFLGGAVDEKIEGKPVCMFISQLMADTMVQTFKLPTLLFGAKFLDLGMTALDRDVNRRIALFRKWGLAYIVRKVNQVKNKIKNQGISGPPEDIIEALVRAHANSSASSQGFYSNQQIFEEFSTFFIAGTDTTSHYLYTMIYYIAQNPQVEQKLRKQIETFMTNEDYSYENLKNFTYIDSIQKQTTRLYGPITGLIARVAKEDNILNGIKIRKGTMICPHYLGNHLSEKYFPDPLVFRPERWQKQCENLPQFVFGGFGGGARTCIGKHLAILQSKIALIKFMKRYKKIQNPEGPVKMVLKFIYTPEYFKSKMTIDMKKEV